MSDFERYPSTEKSFTARSKNQFTDGHGSVDHEVAHSPTPTDSFEVFAKGPDVVDFRTVSWPRTSIIFLKILFATGILSIPTALYDLGAVGGSLSVIGWGALNTYTTIVAGNFRKRHAQCHSIADMAGVAAGRWFKEIAGCLFVIQFVLCASSGILAVSVGLNALSDHAACTVWWSFLATVPITAAASIRKFEKISWLTWAGFISIFTAVFIVVIGVTTRDRPAAAPQTGPYELGFRAIAYPSFPVGITATCVIFISSASAPPFLPVMSEMANPKDYNKAVYVCMALVQSSYLTFSLVVYRWCGQWVANPSLGSAGGTIEKVAYAIGLVGLIVSACLYLHISAKYFFVRILRKSRHLQANTLVHWGTWVGMRGPVVDFSAGMAVVV
ncbi:MAG: hypothetical protein M1822_001048 [Bathelium mastoideum]|nr:MAG: hypothetical protein M1822_001048 [Bathelium mastoideum]